jgi:hypothetical protein
MIEFPLFELPNELLVRIFGFLDFDSFILMKSTCQLAKKVAEKNLRLMPKKEVQDLIVNYDCPSAQYWNCEQPIATITAFCGENSKTFTLSSEDDLMFYLYNLKVTRKLIIDVFNHSFTRHFALGPQVENAVIVELSNITVLTQMSKILSLFGRLKKCNQLRFDGKCFLNGKLSILLDQMDYCFSVCLNHRCRLEFDDECLKVISSKSTPSTSTLIVFAPESPAVISLPALIIFLRSTYFSQNSSITLSRVVGLRHNLITEFFPLIHLENSAAVHYDFQATITLSEGISVRLQICRLQAPSQR